MPEAATKVGLNALEERRRKVHEITMLREKILARYRGMTTEVLEKAAGEKRRAVYNALGVTVWPGAAKGDPITIMFSALGGEEVCHRDRTSTR